MDFRKQWREHAPIDIDRTAVEKVKSFKFLGVHITDILKWSTHTDCGEEGATAPLQPQEAEEIWLLRPSETFTDAQLRASCGAVSPPSTAIAPPATAGLSRGWYGLPNASSGAHCLLSRTPTALNVTGRPKRSRTTTCHPEGEVSTGPSKLGLRDRSCFSISRPSATGYHPATQPCTLEAAALYT